MSIDTMKVKSGDSYALINTSDFNPDEHEAFDEESSSKTSKPTDSEASRYADAQEELRRRESNRGVGFTPGLTNSDKNPSGTFSTPTPSDIRFPDADQTEFENNHGAFVKRSAADLRVDRGLPDVAGGIDPVGAKVTADQSGNLMGVENLEQAAAAVGEQGEGVGNGNGGEGGDDSADEYTVKKERGRYYVMKDGERSTSGFNSESEAQEKADELNQSTKSEGAGE